MEGLVWDELQVKISADALWDVYGTGKLGNLIPKLIPNIINAIHFLEGDGAEGTVIHICFAPGTPGPSSYKERFVKIDNEARVKEALAIEGLKEFGFKKYLVRLEIQEKPGGISVIKSSIQYEIDEEHAWTPPPITIMPFKLIAEKVANYLSESH
ncbi:S-norcoclaurine synthase 1 [Amborella trichopoda]|uniref:Bet v I/Major latex protein domain-containing protein n=1 Tax=Amborella trichopoda TaxID=13333 RepID=U5D556_AMBTC|nr:S-norcoclaurine synthase 1 [Amborella trichopoda]ERN15493.1 hypothetical protein AMTR_s00048p00042950 [Amborella trichopoda]|eukprot:XP_006854026.1 S-norcoclaurine synthase 1 [Amborella trichopoda]